MIRDMINIEMDRQDLEDVLFSIECFVRDSISNTGEFKCSGWWRTIRRMCALHDKLAVEFGVLKPDCEYSLTNTAKELIDFHKIEPSVLLLIRDDVDLAP